MHRKLKVLGVTLVALFALSAVAASSALATEGVLTPGAFPATITASQKAGTKAKFTIGSAGARTVECSIAKLDSTTTVSNSTTSTLKFEPDFTGCITSPGEGPAVVSTTGCDIHVTLTEKISASTGRGSAALEGTSCDLSVVANSTAGSKICEYTIPSQAATGTFHWESAASSPDDVIISLGGKEGGGTLQSSVKVLSGTLAACGASAGNTTIGKLDGELTVTAEVGSTQTSLTIS